MLNSNRNAILGSILIVALFIVIVITGSYAFFTANFKTSGESDLGATAADLKLEFTDGELINAKNLIPGDTATKKFTIENTGNVDISFRIVVKDVVNGFERTQDLKVEVKENGESIKNDGTFPTSAQALSDTITLKPGEKHTYEITVHYQNEEEINQKDDMNKTVSGTIFIEAV